MLTPMPSIHTVLPQQPTRDAFAVVVRLHDRWNRSLFLGALSLRPSTPSIDGWTDADADGRDALFVPRTANDDLFCRSRFPPPNEPVCTNGGPNEGTFVFLLLLLLLRRSLGSSVPRHPSAVRPSSERAPREGGTEGGRAAFTHSVGLPSPSPSASLRGRTTSDATDIAAKTNGRPDRRHG